MPLMYAHKNRTCHWDIVIQDSDGNTLTPKAADTIRATIGRTSKISTDQSTADFTVSSALATANGSTFTKNSPGDGTNRLRLDAADMTFPEGTYDMLIELRDSADGNDWKTVDRYVFVLEDTD